MNFIWVLISQNLIIPCCLSYVQKTTDLFFFYTVVYDLPKQHIQKDLLEHFIKTKENFNTVQSNMTFYIIQSDMTICFHCMTVAVNTTEIAMHTLSLNKFSYNISTHILHILHLVRNYLASHVKIVYHHKISCYILTDMIV